MKKISDLYGMRLESYRSSLTGERLGWTILKSEGSFRPVHRVLCSEVDGPVIIVGTEVFEVDPDVDEVYSDDIQALDAYYTKEQKNVKEQSQGDFGREEKN